MEISGNNLSNSFTSLSVGSFLLNVFDLIALLTKYGLVKRENRIVNLPNSTS